MKKLNDINDGIIFLLILVGPAILSMVGYIGYKVLSGCYHLLDKLIDKL
jgi:hypothetical protein